MAETLTNRKISETYNLIKKSYDQERARKSFLALDVRDREGPKMHAEFALLLLDT